MRQVQQGQVEQLGPLFERHHVKLFNFFLRLTGQRAVSEDLVQDVFFRMLKYRKSFAARRPFRPWMYQVARNALMDQRHRSNGCSPEEESNAAEDMPSQEPTPDFQVMRGQELELLQEALARLPLEKREVLVLSRLQNLRCEEIAAIVRCEVGAVRVRIHRALQDLKAIVSQLLEGKPL